MNGLALCVLSENRDRVAMLQTRLDSTGQCQTVLTHTSFPSHNTDPLLRRMQEARADVVVVDIEPHNVLRAAAAIELIGATTEGVVVLAVGNMQDPATIVAAMRGGAREFLDLNPGTEQLTEALNRLASARVKTRTAPGRARVITVTTAKCGTGGTTVAVNLAVALQRLKGGVLLIDVAHLGHAALHLNVHPAFGVLDALQNLHRLDNSLLDSVVSQCRGGLKLLAGPQQITTVHASAADLTRLFEHLSSRYDYLVVDASGRTDAIARHLTELSHTVLLVSQSDVVSLWSAARKQAFLEPAGEGRRVKLLLNRYRKIPGLSDEEVERLTNLALLWKVPNNYHAVAASIDKGLPLAFHDGNDVGQSFKHLAEKLTSTEDDSVRKLALDLDPNPRARSGRRFLTSALRTGH